MSNKMFVRASTSLMSLVRDEEGASAVEYGLILGILAIVFIAAFTLMAPQLTTLFATVTNAL
ncbi:MAG: Flp family type IVb pilin [Panacagrimonas sp.]